MKLHVRPRDDVETDFKVEFDEGDVEAELDQLEDIKHTLKTAHEKMMPDLEAPEFPKVTFLGTGSSKPGKYRSTSCILVETRPDSYIILDCGEGNEVHGWPKSVTMKQKTSISMLYTVGTVLF